MEETKQETERQQKYGPRLAATTTIHASNAVTTTASENVTHTHNNNGDNRDALSLLQAQCSELSAALRMSNAQAARGRQMQALAQHWFAKWQAQCEKYKNLSSVTEKLSLFATKVFSARQPYDFGGAQLEYQQQVGIHPLPGALSKQLHDYMQAEAQSQFRAELVAKATHSSETATVSGTGLRLPSYTPLLLQPPRTDRRVATPLQMPDFSQATDSRQSLRTQTPVSGTTLPPLVPDTSSSQMPVSHSGAGMTASFTRTGFSSVPSVADILKTPAMAMPRVICSDTQVAAVSRQTMPPDIDERNTPTLPSVVDSTNAVPGAQSTTGLPMTAAIGFRSKLAPVSGATMAPLMTDFSSSQMPVHLAGAGMTARSLPFPVTAMSGVHSVSGRRRLTETSTRGTHAAVSGALPSLTAAHSAASHPMVGTSVSQFTATIAPLLAAGSLPVPVSEVSGVHSAAQLVSDRRHLGAAAIVGCRQLPLATGSRSGHCMDATTATVQDSMPLRKRRRVHAHGSAAAQSRVSWKPVARCGAGTSTSSSTCAVPKKRAAAFGSVESEVDESDDWQPALNISPLLFTKRSGEYVVIHKVDGDMVSLQKEDGTHAVVRKSELRPWEW